MTIDLQDLRGMATKLDLLINPVAMKSNGDNQYSQMSDAMIDALDNLQLAIKLGEEIEDEEDVY